MFFLAGPIQGGWDWQSSVYEALVKSVGECLIVNPCRYTDKHPLYEHRLLGPTNFERQTDWERYFIGGALSGWPTGCMLFWLPSEDPHNPRKDGKPYAMDTRGELGEIRGRLMHDKTLRVAIGAESGFPGIRTIERNFELALGSEFKIHGSWHGVVAAAKHFADPARSFTARATA